jgi:hypothetical protein
MADLSQVDEYKNDYQRSTPGFMLNVDKMGVADFVDVRIGKMVLSIGHWIPFWLFSSIDGLDGRHWRL